MPAECRRIEPKPGRSGLDDRSHVATREAPVGDALRPLVEDPPEDGTLDDGSGLEPGLERRDRTGNLAAGNADLAAEAFLIGLAAPDGHHRTGAICIGEHS